MACEQHVRDESACRAGARRRSARQCSRDPRKERWEARTVPGHLLSASRLQMLAETGPARRRLVEEVFRPTRRVPLRIEHTPRQRSFWRTGLLTYHGASHPKSPKRGAILDHSLRLLPEGSDLERDPDRVCHVSLCHASDGIHSLTF